jgi:hypothetical protein
MSDDCGREMDFCIEMEHERIDDYTEFEKITDKDKFVIKIKAKDKKIAILKEELKHSEEISSRKDKRIRELFFEINKYKKRLARVDNHITRNISHYDESKNIKCEKRRMYNIGYNDCNRQISELFNHQNWKEHESSYSLGGLK